MQKRTSHWGSWVVAVGLAMGASVSSHAGPFGLPSLPSIGGGSSSSVESQVNSFVTSVKTANLQVARGAVQLLQVISTPARAAEWQKQLDKVTGLSDTQEQSTKVAELTSNVSAELTKLQQDPKVQAALKKSSFDQKKQFAQGVFDVSMGMYQLTDLQSSGPGIVSSAYSNPLDATKVLAVKDALPGISSLLTNGKPIVDSAVALARAADIKLSLPTSSSSTFDFPGK